MTTRTVPKAVTHAPGDLITGASWNAGLAASTSFISGVPVFISYAQTSVSVTNFTPPISPAAFVSIALDGTILDSESGHSNVSGATRYICQVAGWYLVSGTIAWQVSLSGNLYTQIAVNGSPVVGSTVVTSANGYVTGVPVQPVLVPLNVTDYVELQAAQDSPGPIGTYPHTTGTQGCSMSVWWVSHL